MRILLVDGSPTFRARAAAFRARAAALLGAMPGVQVVAQAEDADEAIRAFDACEPDVVLLDVMLRTSSGLAVLRHAACQRPEVKVLVLTGYRQPVLRKIFTAAGAYRFLDKNEDFERLPGLLRELGEALPARV